MIHVNLGKSSSSAVYEYFSRKNADFISDVSRDLYSFVCFSSNNGCKPEIEGWLNSIKGVAPSLVDSKDKGRVEMMLKYIEDGDLRRYSLPNIKAFNIGLSEWREKFNCISNPYIYDQVWFIIF